MNAILADRYIQDFIRQLFDLGYPECQFSQDASGSCNFIAVGSRGKRIDVKGTSLRDAAGRAVEKCVALEIRGRS
jgi:hypothetical protein